jgi:hypothetical protein
MFIRQVRTDGTKSLVRCELASKDVDGCKATREEEEE